MDSVSGPWSTAQADAFLRQCTFPLRLAVAPGGAYPRLVSLWYLWQEGALLCASHRSARLLRWLDDNPRCGFELSPNEPPYYGLRGTADARCQALGQADLLERLIDKYLGDRRSPLAQWLLSRKQDEFLIELRPRTVSSWDYRERMRAQAD